MASVDPLGLFALRSTRRHFQPSAEKKKKKKKKRGKEGRKEGIPRQAETPGTDMFSTPLSSGATVGLQLRKKKKKKKKGKRKKRKKRKKNNGGEKKERDLSQDRAWRSLAPVRPFISPGGTIPPGVKEKKEPSAVLAPISVRRREKGTKKGKKNHVSIASYSPPIPFLPGRGGRKGGERGEKKERKRKCTI